LQGSSRAASFLQGNWQIAVVPSFNDSFQMERWKHFRISAIWKRT
jgi:hypothetical protein